MNMNFSRYWKPDLMTIILAILDKQPPKLIIIVELAYPYKIDLRATADTMKSAQSSIPLYMLLPTW